jgi:hypothetical protein
MADQIRWRRGKNPSIGGLAPVAQLDRASVYGTEGQRFESSRAHRKASKSARYASGQRGGGSFLPAFSRDWSRDDPRWRGGRIPTPPDPGCGQCFGEPGWSKSWRFQMTAFTRSAPPSGLPYLECQRPQTFRFTTTGYRHTERSRESSGGFNSLASMISRRICVRAKPARLLTRSRPTSTTQASR